MQIMLCVGTKNKVGRCMQFICMRIMNKVKYIYKSVLKSNYEIVYDTCVVKCCLYMYMLIIP